MRFDVLHETTGRLRLKLPPGIDEAAARVALELLHGVGTVRVSQPTRSMVVHFDGRAATRRALLELLRSLPARSPAADATPPRAGAALPLSASALAAALAPLLPAPLRPPVALLLVAGHGIARWRSGAPAIATAFDGIALASTVLTGHPLSATLAVLLAGIAERRRGTLLAQHDELLAHLAPAAAGQIEVRRGEEAVAVAPVDLRPGDELLLRPGMVLPVDGLVIAGSGRAAAGLPAATAVQAVAPGQRLCAGSRLTSGLVALRAERTAAHSRVERLRAHVRHALLSRDTPGLLTPDLERLLALPVTAAGLVLALTGDAGRSGQMLQADPQHGLALAQPVAREAALYALACEGALLNGLDGVERLAAATVFCFEDVGVLAESHWSIERIETVAQDCTEAQVRRWLAGLAGHGQPVLLDAGLPDEQVADWRSHGALMHDGERLLHIGGAALLAHTWHLVLSEPDRQALVRRLGIVQDGRLVATVYLRCALRPGVAELLEQLRATGVRRIAVFGEDAGAVPAAALQAIGADAVVCESRSAQRDWLAAMAQRGERVALVHTGLRDLLPPGGLSLCPVDADAGAHGVLIGEPLSALLAARRLAQQLRRELRWRFGRAIGSNAALMTAGALGVLPPWCLAALKYGLALLLQQQSAGLATLRAAPVLPAGEWESGGKP